MTRLPALLLVLLCGCVSVDTEKMLAREGEAMTQRQITIGWDEPADGPRPTHYVVRRYDQGLVLPVIIEEVYGTEWTGIDPAHEHKYVVRSVANGIESPDSLPLYRSFAITDLDIRDNGVVVKFACEPNTTYWLEVSRDEGKTWTEVGEITTGNDQREAGIGGDVMVGQREWYRVWKRL